MRAVLGQRRECHFIAVAVAVAMCVPLAVACSSGDESTAQSRTLVSRDAKPDGATHTAPTEHLLFDGASGFAQSGKYRIHYEVFGKGKPLVLVHGWSADIKLNWVDPGWIDALKTNHQVIALDIRGHGDSDKPHDKAAYSYAAMSTDVIAVLDHLGVKRADFVGYSLGADVGAYLMGHALDRFSSFVLIGIGDEDRASLALAPRIAAALRAPSPSDVTDPEVSIYRTIVDLDPRNDREALAEAALEMWPQGYPLKLIGPGVRDVNVPVLILNGAEDFPYVATDHTLAAAIPGARLVEIPGADHFGEVTDSRFRNEVVHFLKAN